MQWGCTATATTNGIVKNVSIVWNVIGANLDLAGGGPFIVTANSVTLFNTTFSLEGTGGWPLPVQLVSFNAVKTSNTSSDLFLGSGNILLP